MASSFYVFSVRTDARYCLVEDLDEKYDDFEDLSVGAPVTNFPSNVVLEIAPAGGDYITDFVNNIFSAVIVSEKAKAVLVREGVTDAQVQYLRVRIADKRKKVLKEPFYLANVLVKVECFDWKRSVYKTFPKKPTKIMSVSLRKLELVEDHIPPDAKLFRLGEIPRNIVIRSDLVEILKQEGCTGMSLVPMGGHIP